MTANNKKNVHFLVRLLSLGDEGFIRPSARAKELHNRQNKPWQNILATFWILLIFIPFNSQVKKCVWYFNFRAGHVPFFSLAHFSKEHISAGEFIRGYFSFSPQMAAFLNLAHCASTRLARLPQTPCVCAPSRLTAVEGWRSRPGQTDWPIECIFGHLLLFLSRSSQSLCQPS